jgi:site-specific DNA-methyltransferase (adenine-specific)
MSAYMPKAKSIEWDTPTTLKNQLHQEFGQFDLDAATRIDNPMNAISILTKEDDALAMSSNWNGNLVYLNPPYGRIISKWIIKAIFEYEKGNAKKIVMLLPARTCTIWFHYIYERNDVEIRFIKGRLRYNDASPAPFPSMLVILG